MSKEKLTPWFPASVKPVRKGVYEVLYDIGPSMYHLWDGTYWRLGDMSPGSASLWLSKSCNQSRIWRGLAEKPE